MTDETHPWGAPTTSPPAPVAAAKPGWYPDPWTRDHHRYWDGAAWTGGSFPHGPAGTGAEGTDGAEVSAATPLAVNPPSPSWEPSPPPPPDWAAPAPYLAWTPPPTEVWAAAPLPAVAPSRRAPLSGLGFVALVVGIMIVVGSLGTLGGYLAFRDRSPATPAASGRPPTVIPNFPGPATTVPADRAASALDSLVLSQADVPPDVVVQPDSNSGQFSADAATLNLCNGTYPSEALRTGRVQVTAYDATATSLISTEAVLYQNPAATEQAFAELKSVTGNCPSTPVTSPIGDPAVITKFNAAPDGSWAATPTVTREAYDFTVSDQQGSTQHQVAVYLRRGRVLMGLYFDQPDAPQVPVTGQTTIETIVGVFAGRIAALPASVVNG